MILINLLPHREAARKRRREIFYAALGAAAVGGLVVAGGIWLWFTAQISAQQDRNRILSTEISKLESQIKDIATLQEEIAALRARQQAVEDLQSDRNMPVHLLNELVKQLPDGVYLTSMKQNGGVVALTGVAQSNERVSELLRNLSSNSPWLTHPELAEIVAGNVQIGKDQRRVANFRMSVKLLRASEVKVVAKAPAAGASGAALPPGAAVPASAAVAVAAPAPVPAAAPAPVPSVKK
ncbi:PilN domain-containing protein [Ramlibacter ginsenosidimutans]|uniref:PilN domain-containing protein n=1 Tax=Ramlibacter ginsenosidimutans TaxID=502333 RepID=A0A934TNN9_9BURK|nr:PilN domain-containing protein [Ramlibacter ginsenosidimutans]